MGEFVGVERDGRPGNRARHRPGDRAACCSRGCSRPRISARECAVSSRMALGRPPSRGA